MNRFFRIARYSGVFVVLFVAFAVSNDCMAHAANAQTANGQSQNSRNWKHYRYDADGLRSFQPSRRRRRTTAKPVLAISHNSRTATSHTSSK